MITTLQVKFKFMSFSSLYANLTKQIFLLGDLPLFGNNIHGRLTRIHLNNNRFSSSIPTVVGEMGSLKDLFLHKNEVIGKWCFVC